MFEGLAGAAILKVLEAFFNAAGTSLLAWLSDKRAKQTLQDLGAATARNEQSQATIAAQDAELQAQADAPQTVDGAIRRLEDGSA